MWNSRAIDFQFNIIIKITWKRFMEINMELPPEEKRQPKTRLSYANLDKCYKEYKGKYYCAK